MIPNRMIPISSYVQRVTVDLIEIYCASHTVLLFLYKLIIFCSAYFRYIY